MAGLLSTAPFGRQEKNIRTAGFLASPDMPWPATGLDTVKVFCSVELDGTGLDLFLPFTRAGTIYFQHQLPSMMELLGDTGRSENGGDLLDGDNRILTGANHVSG